MRLLRTVHQDDTPPRSRTLFQVQVLRQVWIQQYFYDANRQLGWRGLKDTKDRLSRRGTPRRSEGLGAGSPDPASAWVPWSGTEIVTPHDAEARFAHRPGKAAWIGFKDQHVLTAAGANIVRLSECFPPGTTPHRPPRPLTPFQRICQNSQLSPGSWPSGHHQQHPDHGTEPFD
ncbi:hypothetical protein ACIPSA_42595 [Streptomyces sp. NPDC086549]|uniref:hypothetical protein n=1 Tax=Streptomyces sp. NPDC086549 TaxID=3365752 RepID=UPI00380142A4